MGLTWIELAVDQIGSDRIGLHILKYTYVHMYILIYLGAYTKIQKYGEKVREPLFGGEVIADRKNMKICVCRVSKVKN